MRIRSAPPLSRGHCLCMSRRLLPVESTDYRRPPVFEATPGRLTLAVQGYLKAEMVIEEARVRSSDLSQAGASFESAVEALRAAIAGATGKADAGLARAATQYIEVSAGGASLEELSQAALALRLTMSSTPSLPRPLNTSFPPRPPTPRAILVAFDGSEGAQSALQHASLIAAGLRAKLYVIHVITPPPGADYGLAYERDLLPALRRHGDHLLHQACAEPQSAVECTPLLWQGDPPYKIIQASVACGADVIAIGTHVHDLRSTWFKESTAHLVIRSSPCPVLCALVSSS